MPQLCDVGSPGCATPPPPAPSPGPRECKPTGTLPPNTQLNMNLPGGDLISGGAALDSFNVTECYARCLAWNAKVRRHSAEASEVDNRAGKPMCEAWVATDSRPGHPGHPWCWLKSHDTDKGFNPRPQQCFVSAQCRVGVPASEFPCPKSLWT
eukprot:SAG31_NODE_114_length_24318_cov_16.787481_16_plen_153_part_00